MKNLFAPLNPDYTTPEFKEMMEQVFRRRNIQFEDPYKVTREFEKQGWFVDYDFLQVVIKMQLHAETAFEANAA